jgi:hypothetical protein
MKDRSFVVEILSFFADAFLSSAPNAGGDKETEKDRQRNKQIVHTGSKRIIANY